MLYRIQIREKSEIIESIYTRFKYIILLESGKCVGCKEGIQDGAHVYMKQVWESEDCTKLEETDAYGKLRFGVYGKIAQVIRIKSFNRD